MGSQIGVGPSGIDEYDGKFHSLAMKDVLRGCKRVVVIGIHGWFPGPGTFFHSNFFRISEYLKHSSRGHVADRFVTSIIPLSDYLQLYSSPRGPAPSLSMTERALHDFKNGHASGVKLEKITKIPLEGDGTIDKRVERYASSTAT